MPIGYGQAVAKDKKRSPGPLGGLPMTGTVLTCPAQAPAQTDGAKDRTKDD